MNTKANNISMFMSVEDITKTDLFEEYCVDKDIKIIWKKEYVSGDIGYHVYGDNKDLDNLYEIVMWVNRNFAANWFEKLLYKLFKQKKFKFQK